MKKVKYTAKILCAVLALVMCFSQFAFAAETNDTYYTGFTVKTTSWESVSMTGDGDTLKSGRNKTDKTPIYIYNTSATNRSVKAKVLGYRSTNRVADSLGENCTYRYTFVYVPRKQTSSIRSTVYEKGYRVADIELCSVSGTDVISGCWSPDSTKTYTVVTNVKPAD